MNSAPVMNPLSGPVRKATKAAISSAVPTRPVGWNASSSSRGAVPLVKIHPGLMQFTRTSGARLMDSAWVNATSPPLDADYASVFASDICARVDAVGLR